MVLVENGTFGLSSVESAFGLLSNGKMISLLDDLVVDGCGCAFAADGSGFDEFFCGADDAALADVQLLHELLVLESATSIHISEEHQNAEGGFCCS